MINEFKFKVPSLFQPICKGSTQNKKFHSWTIRIFIIFFLDF
jgi:hypothetical protein